MNFTITEQCAYPKGPVFKVEWENYSSVWNNSVYFDAYVCRAARTAYIEDTCASINGHCFLLCGIVGLTSALACLVVFNKKEFSQCLGYFLYKVIACLDLCHMTVMTFLGARYFSGCASSYLCSFINAHFGAFLANACAETVDLIVLYLCIERTTACLLPYFRKLHNKSAFNLVVALAVVLSVGMNAPLAFQVNVRYDQNWAKYVSVISDFGQSSFFRVFAEANGIRLCATGALITLATACSIFGLIRASNHRRKFTQKKRSHEHLVEMCALQLCLALPTVVNYSLLASMKITGLERPYAAGMGAFRRQLPFPIAMDEIESLSRYHILRSAVLVSNLLAHAFHFYFYVLFSSRIRCSAVESFQKSETSLTSCRRTGFQLVEYT